MLLSLHLFLIFPLFFLLSILDHFPTPLFYLVLFSHYLLFPPLLSSCGLRDPSWSEIRHFVKFLDIQLQSCEASVFCDWNLVGNVLVGLKGFVVKFMIRMSRVRQ